MRKTISICLMSFAMLLVSCSVKVMDIAVPDGLQLSPDGEWLLLHKDQKCSLVNLKSGKTKVVSCGAVWLPNSNRYSYMQATRDGYRLVSADPLLNSETILARKLPSCNYRISPTGDYMVLTVPVAGALENQSYLLRYNLKNGNVEQITADTICTRLMDISQDGKKVLYMTYHAGITDSTKCVASIFEKSIDGVEVRYFDRPIPLVDNACFTPSGDAIAIRATKSGLGGMYLPFLNEDENPEDRNVIKLKGGNIEKDTRLLAVHMKKTIGDIKSYVWNVMDDKIYAIGNLNGYDVLVQFDMNIYSIPLAPGIITMKQISRPEENVVCFSLADRSPVGVWQSMDRNGKSHLYKFNIDSLVYVPVE